VLVSTHYMDEAERCHQIGYIFQGRLLLHGSVEEVVRAAGLHAWRVTGPNLDRLVPRIKALPGVEMAAVFGTELHVAGADATLVERGLDAVKAEGGIEVEGTAATLEDVFIRTMSTVGENGA
jgi:ABC-2 type transport system ATP-binding protein